MPFEDPGDDGPSRPLPDPLDRLWVHPSELSAGARTARHPRQGARLWALVVGAGAAGALVTTAVLLLTGALDPRANPSDPPVARLSVAALAARAAPGVVGVVGVIGAATTRSSGIALGDGWVLTSCAAVRGSDRVLVGDADGEGRIAVVRGLDPESDLALLRVDGLDEDLAARDRSTVRAGEQVVALGAGDGSRGWVAEGVVSSVTAVAVSGDLARAGLIATDALVGANAPGGALLDTGGRLVGVLTSGGAGGGIAVPISAARDIASELRHHGTVSHGWLGVGGADAFERVGGGVRVESVATGSPAARAGLAPGDVIVAADGTSTARMVDLMGAVRRHHPGDRLRLRVSRSTGTSNLEVAVAEVPPSSTGPAAGSGGSGSSVTTTTIPATPPAPAPAVAATAAPG